jgi:hypothetical protein
MVVVAVVAAPCPVAPGQEKGKPPLPPAEPNGPWSEQIRLPEDTFLVHGTAPNEPAWVKFTIVLQSDGSHQVYFQDGNLYPFHYPFAAEYLEPFKGMTPEQFDRVTLYHEGRQAVLGAVITAPIRVSSSQPHEYGVQLVGRDPFPKEEVLEYFDAIRPCISTDEPFTAFYFPTYEQRAAAQADRAWLEAHGILISSPDRWADDNTCYSPGWAIGSLKYVEGSAIREAYLSGTLGPNDILLTDGVPAETPYVAGIITLSPSTPNSHVAILTKTFGVPFVHLAVAEDANRAQGLIGHKICLRAYDSYGRTDISLIDLQGVLDEPTIEEIRALKKPPQLDIAPVTPYGSYAMNTDALMPSDIRYFGGKAANFGILRRAIPENAPVAVAFSFDLWNDFLGQKLADGRTLREAIAARLSAFRYPPSDMKSLASTLAGIRELFTDASITDFTETQRRAILAALEDPQYGFDPSRNLRFRSSTNVEDSLEFTGAGLYDSYSGCLADDLDEDSKGPCRCDPNRGKERGAFTAIRKVFASFYNENACLERLRHDLHETEVGMALLVHHSSPDQIELANGVATVRRDSEWSWEIGLVTQYGATSVTNPQGGSIPEEVVVGVYDFGTFPMRLRQSNLVQLGATVMQWENDYVDLAGLLAKVGAEFAAVTGRDQSVLEMEYKKLAPDDKLIVKQVREVPQPDSTPALTPFLVNEPTQYCVLQSESGDIFAHHRLKSRWQLETGSLWLTAGQLNSGLYKQATFEYMADGMIGRLSGPMSDWPAASHDYNEPTMTDTWQMGDLPNPRRYTLHTNNIPTLVSPAESAVVTLRDFGPLTLEVEYDKPVIQWDWSGPIATTMDQVLLGPCLEPTSEDLLQKRRFEDPNGVRIETSFYWPAPPKGPTAGYTAPLARWVETRVTGCTSEPIVLHGYYSQTYKPEHHNFAEHFLFEPQLEPGLSPGLLVELGEKNIRLIHVYAGLDDTTITTYGFQDELPPPADPNAVSP